jgi:hypothetical protein
VLDRSALVGLLEDLAAELSTMGVRGEMFIVGGAAMALVYNTRRSTRDIDAVFEPKTVIYDAAERVATGRGVDPDWLNDAVKGFLPGNDPAATVLFERPGLAVRVASARYLLAMKVMAARVERDEDDIATLAKLSGMESAAAILDLVETAYPHLPVPPRVQYFIEELFGSGGPSDRGTA